MAKFPIFRLSRARDLDLDTGSGHTVMHHSSTSSYVPNFTEIVGTFCGRTDGRTYGRTGGWTFETTLLGRLGGVDLRTDFTSA